MNAVFSIVTRGTISMSCSEAISSSSGGVTDVRSDCGRAIGFGVVPPAAPVSRRGGGSVEGDRTPGQFFQSRDQNLGYLPLTLENKMAGSGSQPACKNLVLDAGPLLSFSPLRNLAQTYYIVPQVISELKDPRAKQHFESLALNAGVRIQVRNPAPSALAHS